MAHMTKKADFLKIIEKMANPKMRCFRGSVYLRDGGDIKTEIEIYRACNMEEAGIISSMNQSAKYRSWM
ncbi:hypothetical protein C3408_17000 [Candidatus Pantoea alvi]|nr:hypothetical protein C3408_17000 [Pantoea alvi]